MSNLVVERKTFKFWKRSFAFIKLCIYSCLQFVGDCTKHPFCRKSSRGGNTWSKLRMIAEVQINFQTVRHYRFDLQLFLKNRSPNFYTAVPVSGGCARIGRRFKDIEATSSI